MSQTIESFFFFGRQKKMSEILVGGKKINIKDYIQSKLRCNVCDLYISYIFEATNNKIEQVDILLWTLTRYGVMENPMCSRDVIRGISSFIDQKPESMQSIYNFNKLF